MLAAAIIGRYVLLLVLVVLSALIVTLRFRKKHEMSFNLWQGAIVTSGLIVYAGYMLYNKIHLSLFISSCVLDALVWIISDMYFQKISLTDKIATQQKMAFIHTYSISKICFCVATYACLVIIPTYQTMLSDFYKQTTNLLWLYEMPINVNSYIEFVIWTNLNTKYSATDAALIAIISLVNIYTITWALQKYNEMTNKYQIISYAFILLILMQYNLYYTMSLSSSALVCLSMGFLAFMFIWWWYDAKTQSIQNLQKK